jgi:hypothetical protein
VKRSLKITLALAGALLLAAVVVLSVLLPDWPMLFVLAVACPNATVLSQSCH